MERTQANSPVPTDSPPRVLVFTDLPALGTVAGRVAMPALIAAGCLPHLIPTCLVSAHGGFQGARVFGTGDFLDASLNLLAKLDLQPVRSLTGFFPDAASIRRFLAWHDQRRMAPLLVDPVMADNGHLYRILSADIVAAMGELVRRADIITPNITEAALLLGLPPDQQPGGRSGQIDWLQQLTALGPELVVLTSTGDAERAGIIALERHGGQIHEFHSPRRDYPVPGAGDYFAACLAGARARGLNAPLALAEAWSRLQRALAIPPRLIRQSDGSTMAEGIAAESIAQ